VKKRLILVAVVLTSAFAAVPVAQASVRPWESTVVPNPWKVTVQTPNPWKSFGVVPNPWKSWRVAPNPFKDWAAATWRVERPNPFLSRGRRAIR
jgi:hypothetical protein